MAVAAASGATTASVPPQSARTQANISASILDCSVLSVLMRRPAERHALAPAPPGLGSVSERSPPPLPRRERPPRSLFPPARQVLEPRASQRAMPYVTGSLDQRHGCRRRQVANAPAATSGTVVKPRKLGAGTKKAAPKDAERRREANASRQSSSRRSGEPKHGAGEALMVMESLPRETGRCSSSLVDVSGGFSEMLDATQRYYVVGGKGGVGRTSMAATLAVKFAKHGEPTLVVSANPTRSLDMSDSKVVRIDGFDSLFATELDWGRPGVGFINNLMGSMRLGTLADLPMLDETLNRFPPGLEEAYALSELIESIELQGTDKFRRVVLDAPSTGHTLKLLSANNWIEIILGIAVTGANAASSKPIFKSSLEKWQEISSGIEKLRQQIARVHELLVDPRSTEFIIVTIPTMMAVSESSRFHSSLKKYGAHTRRLVVNQVLPPSASDCRFCAAKRREQARAFGAIREDPELGGLKLIQAPLLDVEVKGVPALRFLSDSVWK
ncbi:hypothetical protein C2845_PM15G10710 [Panicum miliaceum]|uniref:ArsA/GET3 Anion-transporting ATPase-like domain-containing protein n=1 Tax=Panicum miliaceum TaxID=4540 RepID=A0A3L6Q3M4_PANMI|nr:hypothetical protein C2845_PM15G10710 [Panicum miliaceum]